jgi:hypothetical protein
MSISPKDSYRTLTAPDGVRLFRSDVHSVIVDETVRTQDLVNLRAEAPRVSALRLEQYLNPCNPICSG